MPEIDEVLDGDRVLDPAEQRELLIMELLDHPHVRANDEVWTLVHHVWALYPAVIRSIKGGAGTAVVPHA